MTLIPADAAPNNSPPVCCAPVAAGGGGGPIDVRPEGWDHPLVPARNRQVSLRSPRPGYIRSQCLLASTILGSLDFQVRPNVSAAPR
ncbi:hypothetical protein FRC08_006714, partial [Ceratobasidium sp. 394]